MALTLKDIALALARANGHTDPEEYAAKVALAHQQKDAYGKEPQPPEADAPKED